MVFESQLTCRVASFLFCWDPCDFLALLDILWEELRSFWRQIHHFWKEIQFYSADLRIFGLGTQAQHILLSDNRWLCKEYFGLQNMVLIDKHRRSWSLATITSKRDWVPFCKLIWKIFWRQRFIFLCHQSGNPGYLEVCRLNKIHGEREVQQIEVRLQKPRAKRSFDNLKYSWSPMSFLFPWLFSKLCWG